jgi:hypothetical protein
MGSDCHEIAWIYGGRDPETTEANACMVDAAPDLFKFAVCHEAYTCWLRCGAHGNPKAKAFLESHGFKGSYLIQAAIFVDELRFKALKKAEGVS